MIRRRVRIETGIDDGKNAGVDLAVARLDEAAYESGVGRGAGRRKRQEGGQVEIVFPIEANGAPTIVRPDDDELAKDILV